MPSVTLKDGAFMQQGSSSYREVPAHMLTAATRADSSIVQESQPGALQSPPSTAILASVHLASGTATATWTGPCSHKAST